MAGSMRGIDDIREWKNALVELRRSEVRPEDMGYEVFRILRFSYTRLNDWLLQKCFLYCALFPEDHLINREELIDFLIVEEIMEQRMSRHTNLNKGHSMLNKLVKVSLLEEEGSQHIKMHDLIRDMAIQIMKETCPSIIEAGRQLRQVPEVKYWTEGIVWVSLVKNDITEIPSNYSPMCSTLSTLMLSHNEKLKSIPDSFFIHFRGLKVLDLSKTCVDKLPESVGCLGKLKALSLRWCSELHTVPSLGKLTSLEMLDLSDCVALTQLPEGLELLPNLTFLDLARSGICKLPAGVLRELSHLQFLAFFCYCFWRPDSILEVRVAELATLQKLESLSWRFHDFREFNEYVQLVSRMQRGWQIINYFIYVGLGHITDRALVRPSRRELRLHGCKISRELFIPENLQMLVIEDVTMWNGSGLHLKTHSFEPELRHLNIINCRGMRYLFHLSSSPSILGTMEQLVLETLPELQALFGKEVEETPPPTEGLLRCATSFCSLRNMLIYGCNKMKSLFSPRLFSSLHNLEEIGITQCSEMEMMVAATEDEASCGYNHLHSTGTYLFNLSKLKQFSVIRLPKLKRICNEPIVCDSLQRLIVLGCNELEEIPICLPLLSLQELRVSPAHWWESVKWGNPDQKSALRPKF